MQKNQPGVKKLYKERKIFLKTHTFNIKFTINTPSSKKRFCIYNKN